MSTGSEGGGVKGAPIGVLKAVLAHVDAAASPKAGLRYDYHKCLDWSPRLPLVASFDWKGQTSTPGGGLQLRLSSAVRPAFGYGANRAKSVSAEGNYESLGFRIPCHLRPSGCQKTHKAGIR